MGFTSWIRGSEVIALVVALGIGLLVGLERERRKGDGPARSPAGLRTFTLVSLAGAVSMMLGGPELLAVATAGSIVLAGIGYFRSSSDDPGLTSEVALVCTTLLGGMCVERPQLAAGLGVALTALLAARAALHDFARSVLTEHEIRDGLILAAATLIILPVLPNQPMGPYGAINPRSIWTIVVLIMAIGALGHVSIRMLGPKAGLPISGFASGFVSSTATIGAMGSRALKFPDVLRPATAAAALSTVATIIQLLAILAAVSLPALRALSIPLLCAGTAATIYGAAFTVTSLRGADAPVQLGRAFSVPSALLLASIISGAVLLSAFLQQALGQSGLLISAAIAGLADTHAPAVALAALAASGHISAGDVTLPLLAALSTNTISKIAIAWTSGGRSFATRLVPGLILVVGAAWAGAWIDS